MGWITAAVQVARDLVGLPHPLTLNLPPEHTFDTSPRPVDRVISEMSGGGSNPRIGRPDALSVAAIQRGRNEMCSIATLPLRLYRGLDVVPSALFRQFDPDVPNVVHLAMTIEDLLFEGIAWWQVTGQDFDGYPVSVRRVDPARVSLDPPSSSAGPDNTPAGYARPDGKRYVWVDSQPVSAELMKRFDSPNPGLLKANARAVRRALLLDRLAAMYAENPALLEYFTDGDSPEVDPLNDDEIASFLAEWQTMRRLRPVGWIPSTVKRADVSAPSPKELQLVELQRQVTLELANGLGVDPEDLGVSTTSRTYFNAQDRRTSKVNGTYKPIMSAITDRLSMGDFTRYGYASRFDLTEYLTPDPATQVTYWRGLYDMGAITADEIRAAAGLSGPAPAAATPAALPATSARRPALQLGDITPPARLQLDASGPAFTFNTADFAAPPAAPTVDTAARTITGLAVPYNAVASKYGLKYSFRPGSLEYSAPERMAHLKDHGTPVGFHKSVTDSAEGPVVELYVLDGPEGSPAKVERDQLLYDAEHGLYSGLSVGVDFNMDPESGDVEYDSETGVYNVIRATWRETSTTYLPAFDDARVTKVAASLTGGSQMDPCPHCGQRHAPNIACATFAAQLRVQPAPPTPPTPTQPTPNPVPDPGDAAFRAAYAAFQAAQPGMAPMAQHALSVSPHHGSVQVIEPSPYRFDRSGNLRAGAHDFSSDILSGFKPGGDPAARDRAETFVAEFFDGGAAQQFAVTPANVVNLNYPANRPDLYVDQLEYKYPLYQALYKGSLDEVTPFVVPKFNSSSGLVADHVTGTEPTPGTFTATAQTITPSPVSGKVEVTREVVDQGGNPQLSGLIWNQMLRGWFEALEAYGQAQLVASAASITDLTITTAATDSTLDQAIADALVPLQYVRGGDVFDTVFTQIDLYKAMVKAKDTAGRRLYPQLGAMNAVGSTTRGYTAIDAHGKLWLPAWATAATGTVAASSWMFDSGSVCLWASAPRKIELEWRVAWVDIGIWGYKAFALLDAARTREVVYDPI